MADKKKPANKVRAKTADPRKKSAGTCETNLRHTETRLRKSEANLRKAEKIAKLGNWEWNILTNELLWSDEVFRIYGADPLKDKPSYDLIVKTVAPECRERFVKAVEDAVKHGAPFEGEYRMIGLDGKERFTNTAGEVIRDREGRPVSMFGIVQDITERKRPEEKLKESENRLNTILDNVGAAIFIKDTQYRYTYVNHKVCEIFGRTPEEILGKGDDAFFSVASVEEIMMSDRPVIERGETMAREEVALTSSDGIPHTYWTVKLPLTDSNGTISGLCGISTDITERKRADELLRQIQERLSRAQTIAHVGDWEWDIATNAVHWSDELYRIYGFQPREVAPDYRLVLQQMNPASKDEFLSAIDAALKEDRHFEMDYRFHRKDGTDAVLHTIGRVFRDASGAPVRMVGTVQDLTLQKESERKLRDSEDRFHSIFENAIDGIMIADIGTKMNIEANKAMCTMLGYTRDELLRLNVADIHPNETLPDVLKVFERQQRGERSLAEDIPMLRKDGSVVYADINAVTGILGGRQCLIGIFRDITERKKTETLLEMREKQLAESQRIAHIGSWEHNLTTGAAFWSDELFRLLGLDPRKDPADFQMFFDMIHPDDRLVLKKAIDETVKTGEHFNVDYRFNPRGGPTRIIHAQAELRHDETGSQTILSGTAEDITERKRAEETLQKTSQMLGAIVHYSPLAVICVDTDGNVLTWNPAAERTFGWSEQEVIGKINPIVPKEKVGEYLSLLEGVRHGHPYTAKELLRQRKDGSLITLNASSAPLYDAAGRVIGLLGMFEDITERKRADEALRENEEKFSTVFRQAPLLITLSDIETGRLIDVNDRYLEISGYARGEVIGRTVLELGWITEEDRSRLVRILRDQGRVSGLELSLRRKDGETVVCLFSGETITVNGQQRLLSIAQDITDRKKVEYALLNSEGRYRSLFEDSPVSLWEEDITGLKEYFANLRSSGILDMRTYFADHPEELFKCVGMIRVIAVNKTTIELYETPNQSTLLHNLSLVFTAESLEAFREVMVAIFDGAETHECEAINQTLTGRRITVLMRWSLLPKTAMGSRALVSIVDITARKEAEEKIRQSEVFIRSILDTVDEGFIVIDREYRILTVNKAYCVQMARPCEDIIGKHCYEISHNNNRPCYEVGEDCAVRRAFETGEPQTALHRHVDGKGVLLYVETKGYPIKDVSGSVTSVIETINNITERHLLEEERLKTQKLESIGILAGGIAHDFNNLLQGVFGYISLARLRCDDREQGLAALEEAEKALHLSVKLTNQLLTFSKGGKPVKYVIDLRPVIENAAKFALSGSRTGFLLDIEPDLWQADADGGQVGQVIQNIVLNADQAMPLGGRVSISARNLPAANTASQTGMERRDHIAITIEDQGNGIPEAYLAKIFDPYFTTKEKGSGLGLATSYSIIRNHGGRINVSSVPGKGSTFIIYLPASRAAREQAAVSAGHPAGRVGRILLMDDEPIVRVVAGELLRELGHGSEFAEHGDSAIEKYQRAKAEGRPFDVVILDLTIRGGMGGLDTLRKLKEMDPGVKAVVSSGYSDDEVVATYRQHGFRSFLKKPYDMEELGRMLDDVMA